MENHLDLSRQTQLNEHRTLMDLNIKSYILGMVWLLTDIEE